MKFLGKSSSQVSVDITLMKSKLRESHLSNVNPISTLLGRFSLYRQHIDKLGPRPSIRFLDPPPPLLSILYMTTNFQQNQDDLFSIILGLG